MQRMHMACAWPGAASVTARRDRGGVGSVSRRHTAQGAARTTGTDSQLTMRVDAESAKIRAAACLEQRWWDLHTGDTSSGVSGAVACPLASPPRRYTHIVRGRAVAGGGHLVGHRGGTSSMMKTSSRRRGRISRWRRAPPPPAVTHRRYARGVIGGKRVAGVAAAVTAAVGFVCVIAGGRSGTACGGGIG